MASNQRRYRWRFWLIGIAIARLCFVGSAIAQLIPDQTLDSEQSQVTPISINGAEGQQIDQGARRGPNLFHSFLDFNIAPDQPVYFLNPAGVENIITRITGSNRSELNGTLGILGNANLFLLNPNGILFGPHIQLDLRGALVATTANTLQFGEQGTFSTLSSSSPSALLTIRPSALLFEQLVPGSSITSRGILGAELRTTPKQSLLLLGGEIDLEQARITAPEGNIEIGSVTEAGKVSLSFSNPQIRLIFPNNLARSNIVLSGTRIDVSSEGTGFSTTSDQGNIVLNGHNITLNSTTLRANTLDGQPHNIFLRAHANVDLLTSIITTATFAQGDAGDVWIQANGAVQLNSSALRSNTSGTGQGGQISVVADSIHLERSSLLANTSSAGQSGGIQLQASDEVAVVSSSSLNTATVSNRPSAGQGGDISIQAGRFTLTDTSAISTLTAGTGDAGKVAIAAQDAIHITAGSRISSGTVQVAEGRGGDIDLQTRSLFISDSNLLSVTTGPGEAGDIRIRSDSTQITMNDRNPAIGDTGFFTNTLGHGPDAGDAGDLTLETGSLQLQGGAQLSASTNSQGRGGNLQVNATDTVILSGASASTGRSSGLLTTTETTAGDRGGQIRISTPHLRIADGAVLSAITRSNFRGGNIFVEADSLEITSGGQILTSAFAGGDAGNIDVQAQSQVLLAGQDPTYAERLEQFGRLNIDNDGAASGLIARTEGVGAAGQIDVHTPRLTVRDGAVISAATAGGTGGNIRVWANALEALQGGQLRTTTQGAQAAGNIRLIIDDRIALSGLNSGLFANTAPGSTGNGGSIFIDPRMVALRDGARIAVDSQGTGTGGIIDLQSGVLTLDNASISATTNSSTGGDIQLRVDDVLLMRRDSRISARAGSEQGPGRGGNVNIEAGFVIATPNENNDITANAFTGQGGNIQIQTQSLLGLEERSAVAGNQTNDLDASSEFGVDGAIAINNPEVDPSQGLTELPESPTDLSDLIDRRCEPVARPNGSRFVVTGRGGLPTDPTQQLGEETLLEDLGPLSIQAAQSSQSAPSESTLAIAPHSPTATPETLITSATLSEAQGWIKQPDGSIRLIDHAIAPPESSPVMSSDTCAR